MGTIKVILSDELEQRFREEIFKSKGMKKGNISIAVEEAIKMWIEAQQKKRSEAAKKAWDTRRQSK
jgi:phage gp36-like protein